MLFDCCDGEMARVLKRFNPAGIFIDRFGHYSTEALIAIVFGIRVATQNDSTGLEIIYGLVLALLITFNKVFNDMVHVARSFANLRKLSEDKKVAVPRNKILAFFRSLFNFFPIHRIFHSMELSFIIFISWLFCFCCFDNIFWLLIFQNFHFNYRSIHVKRHNNTIWTITILGNKYTTRISLLIIYRS